MYSKTVLDAYSHNLKYNFEGSLYFSVQSSISQQQRRFARQRKRGRERVWLSDRHFITMAGPACRMAASPLSPRKRTLKEDRNVQVMFLFGRGRGREGLQGPLTFFFCVAGVEGGGKIAGAALRQSGYISLGKSSYIAEG